uniref:Putative ovule protein n=1 Tax=Solanum chacoense TaxID=4108 RepID=A0A0V0GRE8_SOLCH
MHYFHTIFPVPSSTSSNEVSICLVPRKSETFSLSTMFFTSTVFAVVWHASEKNVNMATKCMDCLNVPMMATYLLLDYTAISLLLTVLPSL